MKKNSTISLILFTFLSLLVKSQAPIFQWGKQASGSVGNEYVEALKSDLIGNTFSTGAYNGPADFDPGPGTFTLPSYGGEDVYIWKLDPNGNLVWAKGFGGPSAEHAFGINLDKNGNIYVTGYFMGVCDFDPGPGTFTLSSVLGTGDIFIAKFNSIGDFVWARAFGNNNSDIGNDIVTDTYCNIYTTGFFSGNIDFDPGVGVFNLNSSAANTFISKLDSNGNFVWAKQIVSPGNTDGRGIAIDRSKNIIVIGEFNTANTDLDPGPLTTSYSPIGSDDIYITKLDSLGNYIWGKTVGGFSGDYCYSLCTDTSNNVLVTGLVNGGGDFDPGPGVFNLSTIGGSFQSFTLKLTATGTFLWATTTPSKYNDGSYDITTDQQNNVYTTGFFTDTTDFDPGPGVYNLICTGIQDIYLMKQDKNGNLVWAVSFKGTYVNRGCALTISSTNNIYVGGWFGNTIDCDPGTSVFNLTSTYNPAGPLDAFVIKLNSITTEITTLLNYDTEKIYPNPSNGLLNIDLGFNSHIIIYDAFGREIINEIKTVGNETIDLQKQPDGIYFVKIIQEGKQYTTKIIKE